MNVIVCLDDRGGMTFNGRRQSRDRRVYEDIVKSLSVGEGLLMAEYSGSLFANSGTPFICSESFLDMASDNDTCFVEDRHLENYSLRIKRLTIYRWNRHYPSDMVFDIEPEAEGFTLLSSEDLEGYSHEKITKEIYIR